MGGRMILAAILGGIALFVWGAVAHMALHLGDAQIRDVPAAQAELRAALRASIHEHGIYGVPDHHAFMRGEPGAEERFTAESKEGPYALMVVKPDGMPLMSPMQLVRELATSILLALIATFLIVVAGGLSGPVARIVFCMLLALFGLFQTEVRFWNWYLFPNDFTVIQFVDKLVGGAILGIVIHLVLKKR